MKDVLKFLAKIFGVVLIALFALWMLSLIWNGVKTCPACTECPTGDGWTKIDTNTDDNVSVGGVTLGEETVCDYADGFDSRGKVVPSGTKVIGPASIKPDRDTNDGILLMPGAEYTTEATDEVIWVFVGDEACVNAQAEYFSSVTTIDN
jgi:hypothetical protein